MTTAFCEQLADCRCCPRNCGVNRLAGETGLCRMGAAAEISYAGLHHGEEPPISGSRGSGTIFFVGCNLRCVVCQNYEISQDFAHTRTQQLTIGELAGEMLRLQQHGAHNINFVSPSQMVPQMADAIIRARERGLTIPIVYNSNGYDSVDMLRQIRGLVDIYLPDLKYLDDKLGKEFSAVEDYAEIVPAVMAEMFDQVGLLECDEAGVARRGVLVRHLVLPGCVENSRRCLALLAELSPDIAVSIMSQYSPQYHACAHPPLDRLLTPAEYDEVTDYALELGLENAFMQEMISRAHYLPRFHREQPFEN
jgi:putative pyruvate formate lyase activating enzyme